MAVPAWPPAPSSLTAVLTALLDGALFAERTGSGDPEVLALHGWGRDRTDLLPVLAGRDGLSPDLPGFGASPPPPVGWGSREYAEALAPLLEAAPRPLVLVGHSFGGRVAVQLAAGWPERVRGVLLTGVPLLRPAPSGARAPLRLRAAKRLHALGVVPASVVEAQRRRYGSADYNAASGVLRDSLVRLVNEDYRDLLPQVSAPVEMVWGAGDTAATPAMAREAQALLPAATLSVSPTSAHLLDDALVALLRERLDVLLRAAP